MDPPTARLGFCILAGVRPCADVYCLRSGTLNPMTLDSVSRPSKDQPLAVCVFAGSQRGIRQEFIKAARDLGQALAEGGFPVIYGGGGVGLMGAFAEAVIASGGDITGVFPEFLADHERPPGDLTRLIEVRTLHERKATMAQLAGAFVALPGGLGTLEETLEAMTWTQLGLQVKPCGLLNVCDFYSPLWLMLSNSVSAGLLAAHDLHHVILAEKIPDLIERLTAWKPERQHPRTIANVMEKRGELHNESNKW